MLRKLITLLIPSQEKVEIQAFETWQVTWRRRTGDFSSSVFPTGKLFPTKEEAELFQQALIEAFELVQHDHEIEFVEIVKV